MSTAIKTAPVKLAKRPRVKEVLPSACPVCEKDVTFTVQPTHGDFPYRGDTLRIEYEHTACPECGFALLAEGQLDAMSAKIVAAYQHKHDLMTASEVRQKRQELGYKTQQEFADAAPGVAIATLKRIETGLYAQEPHTDMLLRDAFERLDRQRRREAVDRLRAARMVSLGPVTQDVAPPMHGHSALRDALFQLAATYVVTATTIMHGPGEPASRMDFSAIASPDAEMVLC